MQRHRLQMSLLSLVNVLLQSVVIALFAASGATSWDAAIAFALTGLATAGLFVVAVARGWVIGLGDAWLLCSQLVVSFAVQMAFLIIAPTLWIVFLASTLIACSYAMVAFTPRQFTWLWLGYGVATALALFAGRHRFGTPAPTAFNIAVIWLFFFMGVHRLAIMGAQFTRLREQLSEKNKQLTVLLERNREMAIHDELTGAFNRRHLMERLSEERDIARRTGEGFSVAIFDLDHFKAINDQFGHAGGDAVLRQFCALAREVMRTGDLFARYGGEEFVLLMPRVSTPDLALRVAERIRSVADAHDWVAMLGEGATPLTVSAGIGSWWRDEPLEMLLARADSALYEAKRNGRNRSIVGGRSDVDVATHPPVVTA